MGIGSLLTIRLRARASATPRCRRIRRSSATARTGWHSDGPGRIPEGSPGPEPVVRSGPGIRANRRKQVSATPRWPQSGSGPGLGAGETGCRGAGEACDRDVRHRRGFAVCSDPRTAGWVISRPEAALLYPACSSVCSPDRRAGHKDSTGRQAGSRAGMSGVRRDRRGRDASRHLPHGASAPSATDAWSLQLRPMGSAAGSRRRTGTDREQDGRAIGEVVDLGVGGPSRDRFPCMASCHGLRRPCGAGMMSAGRR